jgi:hypothetical protein
MGMRDCGCCFFIAFCSLLAYLQVARTSNRKMKTEFKTIISISIMAEGRGPVIDDQNNFERNQLYCLLLISILDEPRNVRINIINHIITL